MKTKRGLGNFESLKLIYDKAAEHHKYYLSWRHYLLVGYFVVVAFSYYASFQLIIRGDPFNAWAFLIPLLVGVISFFFKAMDTRNMDLYHICQNVGNNIEKDLLECINKEFIDKRELFGNLSESHKKSRFTHAQLIRYLYNSMAITSFFISCILFIVFTLGSVVKLIYIILHMTQIIILDNVPEIIFFLF